MGQARAIKTLVAAANEGADVGARADDVDTFIGVGRKKLLRSVLKIGPSEPKKLLLNFRKVTAQRSQLKARMGVWQGFAKGPVKLKPKPGGAQPTMVALPRPHFDQALDAAAATPDAANTILSSGWCTDPD